MHKRLQDFIKPVFFTYVYICTEYPILNNTMIYFENEG